MDDNENGNKIDEKDSVLFKGDIDWADGSEYMGQWMNGKTYFVEPKPPLKIKNTHVKIYEDKNATGAWSDASELADIEIKSDEDCNNE